MDIETDSCCCRATNSDMALSGSMGLDITLTSGSMAAYSYQSGCSLPPSHLQFCLSLQHTNHFLLFLSHLSTTYMFIIDLLVGVFYLPSLHGGWHFSGFLQPVSCPVTMVSLFPGVFHMCNSIPFRAWFIGCLLPPVFRMSLAFSDVSFEI